MVLPGGQGSARQGGNLGGTDESFAVLLAPSSPCMDRAARPRNSPTEDPHPPRHLRSIPATTGRPIRRRSVFAGPRKLWKEVSDAAEKADDCRRRLRRFFLRRQDTDTGQQGLDHIHPAGTTRHRRDPPSTRSTSESHIDFAMGKPRRAGDRQHHLEAVGRSGGTSDLRTELARSRRTGVAGLDRRSPGISPSLTPARPNP